MGMLVIFVILAAVCIACMAKTNSLFSLPSSEEFKSYQKELYNHIDEEIEKYENDIKDKGEPLLKQIQECNKELENKINELKNLNLLVDEKLIKINNFEEAIKNKRR